MHSGINPFYVFGILLLTGPMIYVIHCASDTLIRADGCFHRDGGNKIIAEAIFWFTTTILIFPLVFTFHNMEAAFVKPEAWWVLYVNVFAYGVGFEGIIYLLRHPYTKASRRPSKKSTQEATKEHETPLK